MKTLFEAVHTVEEYYDGPRVGIADFQGAPHLFRSLAWGSNDWNSEDDRFELKSIGSNESPTIVRAIFRVRQPASVLAPGVLRPLEVQWTLLEE